MKENVGYRIIREEVFEINQLKTERGICIGYHPKKNDYVIWEFKRNLTTLDTDYYNEHYIPKKQRALYFYHDRLKFMYGICELNLPPFEV